MGCYGKEWRDGLNSEIMMWALSQISQISLPVVPGAGQYVGHPRLHVMKKKPRWDQNEVYTQRKPGVSDPYLGTHAGTGTYCRFRY